MKYKNKIDEPQHIVDMTIRTCSNGFEVVRAIDQGMIIQSDDVRVFNSIDDMFIYLRELYLGDV